MENIEKKEPEQEEQETVMEELEIVEPKTTEKEESHHSHHSQHSHSSHHSSHKHHGSRSKKKHAKKQNPLQKKIEEYAVKALVLILVFVVTIMAGWCISANSEIDTLFKKHEALTLKLEALEQQLGNLQLSGITGVDKERIPAYVQEEADAVVAEVLSLQNSNTISFIAITDMHLQLEQPDSVTAIAHAGQAMGLIRERLDIDFAVNLGDITSGSDTTAVETAVQEIQKVNALLRPGFDGIPNFRTPGNHDLMLYGYAQNQDYLDAGELYSLIGSYNKDAVTNEQEKDRGFCYRDFADKKLRVICLNTSDIKDVNTFSEDYISNERFNTVSKQQLQWLCESLKLSGKGEGWQILLLSHIPLYAQSNAHVETILDAYVAGSAGTVTVDGSAVSFDFSGQNSAKLIANIHGHLHNHRTDAVGNARIPAINIPNASIDRNRSNDYPDGFGEKVVYEKIAGTADETAFCVVTIDLKTSRIYVTAYGAGYSRQLAY